MPEEIFYTLTEIRDYALNKMRELNIYPAEPEKTAAEMLQNIDQKGGPFRYQIEGQKRGSKNGRYTIHSNGTPAGYLQDMSGGADATWTWKMDGGKCERTNFDYAEWEAERAKREAEQEERYAEAAEKADEYFQQCEVYDFDHPYLEKKHIGRYTIRINRLKNFLVIPLYDITGKIISVQEIHPDGVKRFFPGARAKGVFFPIGLKELKDKNTPILLGEGVATMATVRELTGDKYPCVAAMDCGNLKDVAKTLKSVYANPIIIMADNDLKTQAKSGKNPGLDTANAIQKENQGLITGILAPPFSNPEDGSDWNDYAVKYGEGNASHLIGKGISDIFMEIKRQKYAKMADKLGNLPRYNFASFCTPPEGTDWLIQDWIPAESQLMMFAPSASGKGFMILDIAFSIACPYILKWHGFPIIKHGPVVYMAGEGQRGLRKRSAGLSNYKNVPFSDVELYFIPIALPLDDKNPDIGINKAIANIGVLTPDPVLVIIDTTNRYMCGDENKTPDATAYVNACTKIMQEFEHCSVLTVHHTGQAAENQGRARGSGVFKASMDMEYRLKKSGSVLTLEMSKSKDTEEQKPLSFRLKNVDAPGYNGTTCVLNYDEGLSRAYAEETETDEPEEKITQTEIFARDTYRKAASEYGVIITDDNGNEIPAVDVKKWKEVFYSMTSADKDNVKRALFSKTRKLLLEEKRILFKENFNNSEYYCLCHDESTYEVEILRNIQERTG